MTYPTADALGVNLSSLNIHQLDGLICEASEALKLLRKQEEKKDLALIKELAAKHGLQFTLTAAEASEGAFRSSSTGGSPLKGMKHPPRFRNPANFSETWTGLGRKPVWVQTYLDNGGELDALRIKEGEEGGKSNAALKG
ncbi:H-NS histone family protein [Chromobacterium amazonense]|nr:H-NS histone family protein [Chromobacterium amazonense]